MSVSSQATSRRIFEAFAGSDLSDISKKQYRRRLEFLAERTGHPDVWSAIEAHSETISGLMHDYKDRPASLQAFASAVMSSFKHVPDLEDSAPATLAAWKEVHKASWKPLLEHALSTQPTKRQAKGWVPYDVLVAKRNALPVSSDARLLLSMYTMIPAKRNDYSLCLIYTSPPPAGTRGNYLVLPETGQATLTLNEYKTSRLYGEMVEDLPDALVAEIRESLARRPRGHLFISNRDGKPYKPETVFGNWANKLLERTFRKPVTLTLLRHAYITALKFDEMTGVERSDIARRMKHSVEEQMQYKFIFTSLAAPASEPQL